MIEFTVPIAPVAQGRPRFTRAGFAYTPAESRRFKNEFRLLAKRWLPAEPLTGPLRVTLAFNVARPKRTKNVLPITRPDLDNYVKAVLDAMNPDEGWRGFWLDDSQVISMQAAKAYGDPAIAVWVCNLGEW